MNAAEARHQIANLLHTYTEIADRKDIPAVLVLLGSARVTFPVGGYQHRDDAQSFFSALWSSPQAHRHDVSNLVVTGDETPVSLGVWRAHAHYTRWTFEPDPVLHTLGSYDLIVDGASWRITDLTVTRTWTKA